MKQFARNSTLDIFIGGLLDRVSGIVVGYHKVWREQHPERRSEYFEHYQQRKVCTVCRAASSVNPRIVINLVGHSWGALVALRAAEKLAAQGIQVSRVISIDPVSRRKPDAVPRGCMWINVNAAPRSSNGWHGDHYAALGGKWGVWPRQAAARHIEAPGHHNEFRALFEYSAPGGVSARDLLLADFGDVESTSH